MMLARTCNPAAEPSRKNGADDRSLRRARQLFGALVVFTLWWVWIANPFAKPFESLLLATLVVLAGCWPLFRWLGDRDRDAIPVLAMHALFYAVVFGVPGFLEPGRMFSLGWTTEGQRQAALLMALMGLAALYAGYYGLGRLVRSDLARFRWPLQVRHGAYPLLVTAGYPLLLLSQWFVGQLDIGVLSQILSAVDTFLFFLILHGLFSARFGGFAKVLVLWVLVPYKLLIATGLAESHIAGFVVSGIAIGITYAATRRRVPYFWVVAVIAVFALLQPIKGEYRYQVWKQGLEAGPIEKLQLFTRMGWNYYFSGEGGGGAAEEGIDKTFDRINHLMVTAAIYADTPERQPFLHGQSYLPLLTKWIPRFLWPGKPEEDFGNRWAQRYGYLGAYDYRTSFNLPWLPEMYMNFGYAGVVGVNLLVGLLFRFLAVNLWQRPRDSSAFAFGMVMGVSLMFVESNLSLMLGREIIVVVALVVIGFVASRLLPGIFVWRRRG